MAIPLTFGVEFEMAVADSVEWGDHTDPRFIAFDPDPYADAEKEGDKEGEESEQDKESKSSGSGSGSASQFDMPYVIVARHMANTLRAAGFKSTVDQDDNRSWDFTCDMSVEAPPEDEGDMDAKVRYGYEAIELRSPALYFTPESLQAVADVLKLLKRTYIINTNMTTGLHVHVGDGKKGWPFSVTQKFFAFMWCFENQLRTLFPPSRIGGEYTKSIRDAAPYVLKFRNMKGRRPTPMEGLVTLLSCPSYDKLSHKFKVSAFRMAPQAKNRHGKPNRKPTIEWRQHGGTMDEVSVCIWIKTIVGTMEYLRNVHPSSFTDLLLIVAYERWEKLGDGKDDEREEEMGPILAEGEFTIIDLLQTIGVYEPAEFYGSRGVYKIEKDRSRLGRPFKTWLFTPRAVQQGSSTDSDSQVSLILTQINEDDLEPVGKGEDGDDGSEVENLHKQGDEILKMLVALEEPRDRL